MDCQAMATDELMNSMICIGNNSNNNDNNEEDDQPEVKLIRHKKLKKMSHSDLQNITLRQRLYERGERVDRTSPEALCQCLLFGDEINVYMKLLNEKYGSLKLVHCLDSWFIESLLLAKGRDKISDDTKMGKFFSLLVGSTAVNSFLRIPRRIIIPFYHPKLFHWTLICICPYTHHIILTDPYDGKETVYSRTKTRAFEKMLRIAKVIIDLMFFYKHHSSINHIFKTNVPWAICRTFQMSPQYDYQSCGFYVLKCARLCCEQDSLADIIIFAFEASHLEKRTIAEEIIYRTLQEGTIEPRIINFNGIENNTHNFKYKTSSKYSHKQQAGIIDLTDTQSVEKRIKCIINPNFVSRRTEPNVSWFEKIMEENQVRQTTHSIKLNIYLARELEMGTDFTFVIKVHTQWGLGLVFDTITKSNPNLVQKNINDLYIFIISDEVYEVMDDTDYIVSLKHDRDSNDMIFESENGDDPATATESKVSTFNELIACLFHSLCRSCKNVIVYSLKENYKFNYNVKSKQYYVF